MQFCVWGYERYEELDKVYKKTLGGKENGE